MEVVRRLRELIGRYWRKVKPPDLNSLGHLEAMPLNDDERMWNRLLEAGGCEACDTRPKGFIEGPSGGMSTNVFCPHCGQGYNLTPIASAAQKIHRDPRYIVIEETANRQRIK